MSIQAIVWALRQRGLTDAEKLVLVALANCLNGKTKRCDPSTRAIGEDLGKDRRTVRRCLRRLERAGLITAVIGGGRHHTNRYDMATEKGDGTSSFLDLKGGSTVPLSGGERGTAETLKGDGRTPRTGITGSKRRSSSPRGDDGAFDRFWKAYPRKAGKAPARKAWTRALKTTTAEAIIADVERRAREHGPWHGEAQYIPHPATYLNQERWTDPIEPLAQARGNGADGPPVPVPYKIPPGMKL